MPLGGYRGAAELVVLFRTRFVGGNGLNANISPCGPDTFVSGYIAAEINNFYSPQNGRSIHNKYNTVAIRETKTRHMYDLTKQ